MRRITFPFILLFLAGCGGPQFGSVSGLVTLDGEPLANATVQFQPEGAGSPAFGTTDENGRYELNWSAEQGGAPVGKHRVRIKSYDESKPRNPERVPERFNRQTTLIREVTAGSQTFDFDLKTTEK